MFRDICEKHHAKMPDWAKGTPYERLLILHKVIDGDLYSILDQPFTREKNADKYISIFERRPSAQYNLPRTTALKIMRKMFAGRQRPSWRSDDESVVTKADLLAREGLFHLQMQRAAFLGTVGASAMSFSFLKDGDQQIRVIFNTHPAHECLPAFDSLAELVSLRINRCVSGAQLMDMGYTNAVGEKIEPKNCYWYLCEFTKQEYVQYVPIPEKDYSPTNKETWNKLHIDTKRTTRHGLGFVPAHWMCDMSLGELPWGGCFFEKAMDMSMLIDYTISQEGRGLHYGAAPQLQIKGQLKNQSVTSDGGVLTGAANVLHFDADKKDAAGNSIGGGEAKMIEASGAAFGETREYIEMLRKFWLEQVQSSRKDPDRMRTAGMSGDAMENMDEDLVDLMNALADTFAEQGMLVIMKKALRAARKLKHPAGEGLTENMIGGLTLQHAPAFSPGSHEILETVQAMVAALGEPETPATPGANGGPGKPGTPGTPALLELEEAQAVIRTTLNLPLLNKEPSRQ
jgi:hypothetical protein